MVARIMNAKKLSAVLQYNEEKVAQNRARLIDAKGFLQNKDRLTFSEKLQHFQRWEELNDRSQIKTLHISVNFHPSEHFTDERMMAIADRYLESIHLNNQTALIYRHEDAGHPHLHIAVSLIRTNGTRIDTYGIGERLSKPACKALEKEFDLHPATQIKQIVAGTEEHAQKVTYGDGNETQGAIQKVLQSVNRDYHFTSLAEYNAILRQYNVMADTGGERSRSFGHGGLFYRVLDEQGYKVGRPIKASQFPEKPTLANLQHKFERSLSQRREDLSLVRHKIDWALVQQPSSLSEFLDDLRRDGVEVIRHLQGPNAPNFTFVDNESLAAISTKDLGKNYDFPLLVKNIPGAANLMIAMGRRQETSTNALSSDLKTPQVLADLVESYMAKIGISQKLEEDQTNRIRPRL